MKINAFSGSTNLWKILKDFISLLKYFKFWGALIQGGRLFNLNPYFGGRLFEGGAYSKEGA